MSLADKNGARLGSSQNPVQMPLSLRAPTHSFGPTFPNLVREILSEPTHPEPDVFVVDIYAALVKQVFNVAKLHREPNIHHHRKLDNFVGRLEVAKRVLGHLSRLNAPAQRINAVSLTMPYCLRRTETWAQIAAGKYADHET